jgi:hypothetical protein
MIEIFNHSKFIRNSIFKIRSLLQTDRLNRTAFGCFFTTTGFGTVGAGLDVGLMIFTQLKDGRAGGGASPAANAFFDIYFGHL